MTACVKNHSKRVALAISASLVGALTLGAAAPAVAFAEGIAAQSVTATDGLEGGKLTGAVDIENKKITIPATGEITFVADGKPQGVIPSEVTIGQGVAVEKISLNDFQYTLKFYEANEDFSKGDPTYNGVLNQGSAPFAVGKYVVEMTLTSGVYAGSTISVPFEIKAAELDGLTAVDSVDGSFEYDGTDQLPNIDYKIGDKLVDADLFNLVSIKYGFKKGSAYNWELVDAIEHAGDYSMVLVGKPNTIYAGSETEVKITIDKLNLEDAVIVAADDTIGNMTQWPSGGAGYDPTIISVNGKWNANLEAAVKTAFKSGPDTEGNAGGSNLIKNTGVYTYTMDPVAGNTDVEKTGEFTFIATDAITTDFRYQQAAFPTSPLHINLGLGQSFTPDKIQGYKPNGTELSSGEYTVEAKNVDTGEKTTDLSKVNTPGTWVVTAKVNAKANKYTLGGSASMTVCTYSGIVNTKANVWFSYDNKIVSGSKTVEYDGTDKLDDLKIAVTDSYGNLLAEDEDYQVIVTDKAGNRVDQVVDAGTYTVTVSSDSYVINENDPTGAKLTLTVSPVSVKEVRAAASSFLHAGKDHILPYTGAAINPAIEYKAADGTWKALPSDLYTLTFTYNKSYSTTATQSYKKVDEMKEIGYYKAYLHAVRDNDPNWDMSGASGSKGFIQVQSQYDKYGVFKVSDQKVFADVENTFWGAQGIFDAVDLGYMSGYKGTTFFGPLDHLTRAQAAVVLYNMGTGRSVPETSTLHVSWVERGLAFPDAEQWYAVELGWASTLDIVKGYPTGMFGGSDEVTREQFAIMLRNYAAAKGEDVSVDDVDAALADVKDAGTVSDWAREAVAWAVENGVMGAEGYVYADQSIERAQAALMVTRYQPQELDKDDYLVGNVK